MFPKPKIGLALGGGGARGFAHIGILKVLEREKIPIGIITGSSAGSLIGAMYALNPDIENVENKLRDLINSDDFKKTRLEQVVKKKEIEGYFNQVVTYLKEKIVINLAHSRTSLVNNRKLKDSLEKLLFHETFEETIIKFGAISSDLVTGRDVLLTSGNLVHAIAASSSIPGFLPPVNNSKYKMLDGCITQPVPIKAAYTMGADIVIGVDIAQNLDLKSNYDNIFEIITRTNHMTAHAYNSLHLEKADIVIKPKVGQYHWSEFSHINSIIDEGENAAIRLLPRIRKLMARSYLVLKKMNLR